MSRRDVFCRPSEFSLLVVYLINRYPCQRHGRACRLCIETCLDEPRTMVGNKYIYSKLAADHLAQLNPRQFGVYCLLLFAVALFKNSVLTTITNTSIHFIIDFADGIFFCYKDIFCTKAFKIVATLENIANLFFYFYDI